MKALLKQILFLFLTTLSYPQVTNYVNPFIGTSNGGNTFPGAVVPWGMVSVSPHNSPRSLSGYIHGAKYFYGFGQTHLSGTGCSDFGSVVVNVTQGRAVLNEDENKSEYSNEFAEPGYYSLFLNKYKIKAEASVTERCGILKFIIDNNEPLNVFIEAGKSLNLTGGGSVRIISSFEFEGSNISGGFCGENNRQTVYFAAKFDSPSDSAAVWVGNEFIRENNKAISDTSLGCYFNFKKLTGGVLLLKIGISYVSIENARDNLQKEVGSWDFNYVRSSAKNKWETNLSRITIKDDNDSSKIKFYSAIYHMLIHPSIISDENGDYPLMGRKGTGNYQDRKRYSVFSLWDTYRTLHPFLALVFPEIQSEIVKTMIDMYKENGYLPKWEIAANETYMMTGDPASCVIADSYIKGIRDFDAALALDAMMKPATFNENQKAPPIRAGYHELLKFGYIPFEQDKNEAWWVWGPVSTSLEYNLSDWSISKMASTLGKDSISKEYLTRSFLYKNLFDNTTLFMRPKLKNGNWLQPFDSLATEGSGDWSGSGGPGYVEGNAWHYTWFVPHDIPGLIKLFGGSDIFSSKLIRAFKEDHFTINNEPDFAYPYLFTYVKGKEELTRFYVKTIMDQQFGTGPGGLPGNDDCGTTSGWFVFSAMGFYPDCPASAEYRIGIPLFDKLEIKLNNKYFSGKSISILKMKQSAGKNNSSFTNCFLNGKKLKHFSVDHNNLVKGGDLIFK